MAEKEEEHLLGSNARGSGLSYTNPARSDVQPKSVSGLHHLSFRSSQSSHSAGQRPLIDYVSNKWQDEKFENLYHPPGEDNEPGCCDFDEESSCPTATRNLFSSRRFRRMFALILLAALALYYLWSEHIHPHFQEELLFTEGFLDQQRNGTYGLAKGGDTSNMRLRIQTLDPSLIPGGSADPHGNRRLIFIGDVHGCHKQLLHLLSKASFDSTTDHLILAGDTISKGPDSPAVLDTLIHLNATSVRGNHEDRILTAAHSILDSELSPPSVASSSKSASKDAALIRKLKPHHFAYLMRMPLILRIPALPKAATTPFSSSSSSPPSSETVQSSFPPINEEILVVHAGLVPGVPLKRQDPYFVMNMRSIHHRTHVPSSEPSSKANKKKNRGRGKGKMLPWADLWGWYNQGISKGKKGMDKKVWEGGEEGGDREEEEEGWWGTKLWEHVGGSSGTWRTKREPQVVVYGHDAKSGLQLRRWSKGLDSGCVGGGELTALVVDARGKQKVFGVGCKDWLG